MTAAVGTVDTVVVGGGQAGLAAGRELARRGREFAILDAAARPGESWRRRWDSLRLFTPAGFSHLPGLRLPAAPASFPGKDAIADHLAEYAVHFRLPVEHGVRVERLERRGAHFLVAAGARRWRARAVVVATGAHAVPRLPACAGELGPTITQIASVDYRRPSQVPAGPVLVVGAGNSGAEIALDLAASHEVRLAGREVGSVPAAFASPAAYPVLRALGRAGAALSRRAIGGRGDPLGMIRPGVLAAAGVVRVPPVAGVRAGLPLLAGGRVVPARTVVWCTGLEPDHGFVRLPVRDGAGRIAHRRGITAEPGLYLLGMPFQGSITSHLVGGVGADARRIVAHLVTGLTRAR